MAKKNSAGKVFALLAAGAAACAGAFYYLKNKKKEDVPEEEPEEETPELKKDEEGNVEVHTDMPGILTQINVHAGDHVNAGYTLALLGNNLPVEAPVSGTVASVSAEADTLVSPDDVLMAIRED